MTDQIENFGHRNIQPLVSIIVLNCNGSNWLPKCFAAIQSQTILDQIETILVDNNSSDDSVVVGRRLLVDFPCARIVRNSKNLGFCEGNNSGARVASGRYLFFLNNDTWMEPDCMEQLIAGTEKLHAVASTPYVLNYPDNSFQDFGFYGFDVFGLPSPSSPAAASREIFIPGGCAYLIRTDVFNLVGMFDADFFIYSDDADLAWRLTIAGYKAAGIFEAKLHHRGAAGVNPAGGIETVEFRTTDKKRFLTNRNALLTLLKNGQHLLLILVIPLVFLFFVESLVGSLILRRASFIRVSFWNAVVDCWRMREKIHEHRSAAAQFRRRSDFWMLKNFRFRLNRWFEIKRIFHFGLPQVDGK